MAKIFADQGYLAKAADIYRRLVARYPHRQDLCSALAQVEARLAKRKGPSHKEVGLLLREWRDLMLRFHETEREHGGQAKQKNGGTIAKKEET